MGTSTKYEAPAGGEWTKLKTKITQLVTQGKSSPTHIREIVKIFLEGDAPWAWVANNGEGGERGKAALIVARNIGRFFCLVIKFGFYEAFKGTCFENLDEKSVSEIRHSLFIHLGCPGNINDEIDARNALLNLLNEIFKDIDTLEEVEQVMKTLCPSQSFVNMIRRFFGHYFCEQFSRMFHEPLLQEGKMPAKAIEGVHKIREGIWSAVEDIISNRNVSHIDVSHIDWNENEGYQIVYETFQEMRKGIQEVLANED